MGAPSMTLSVAFPWRRFRPGLGVSQTANQAPPWLPRAGPYVISEPAFRQSTNPPIGFFQMAYLLKATRYLLRF